MAIGPARHRFTSRADGDLRPSGPASQLALRRATIAPGPWTWLRQVHGADVVVVTAPGEHAGAEADAAVTTAADAVLAVTTADCAPVVLMGDGVVGVAHAGWRGVRAGVIAATVEAMQSVAEAEPGRLRAAVGPCICPACYEFGEADLEEMATRFGDGVRAVSQWQTPALDLGAAVRAALEEAGVTDITADGRCTGCSNHFFSHRARSDTGRQAGVAWLDRGSELPA